MLERMLHAGGDTRVVEVTVSDGGKHNVLVKNVQREPVGHRLLHADFYAVNMSEKQRVTVPLVTTGKPAGMVTGVMVLKLHEAIHIEALPADIPGEIEVDISPHDDGTADHDRRPAQGQGRQLCGRPRRSALQPPVDARGSGRRGCRHRGSSPKWSRRASRPTKTKISRPSYYLSRDEIANRVLKRPSGRREPGFFVRSTVLDSRLLVHRFVKKLCRIDGYAVDAHFPV